MSLAKAFRTAVQAIMPKRPQEITLLWIALLLGLGLLALNTAITDPTGNLIANSIPHHGSVAMLTAGAATVTGAFLGFLFGIPRTVQTKQATAEDGAPTDIRANTNLEEISDWLTKILVGVGLTQITTITQKIKAIVLIISPGFDPAKAPAVLAWATITYFPVLGFLFGWLWTRLYLPGALREADLVRLKQEVQDTIEQISNDERVRNMVISWLNPPTGASVPTDKEEQQIKDAVISASGPNMANIFHIARDARRNSSPKGSRPDPKTLKRTIPIFQALIEADKDSQFHRNYGQLAYALLEKTKPDWQASIEALTKAIEIRDQNEPSKRDAWLLYEFNRSLCRIRLAEQSLDVEKGVPEELRRSIFADLKRASLNDDLRVAIDKENIVPDWLKPSI